MRTRKQFAAVLLAIACGCAQSTDTPITQKDDQVVVTPTTTQQDQAAQGSQVNVWVLNHPGKEMPAVPMISVGADGIKPMIDQLLNSDPDSQNSIAGTNHGHVQSGIYVSIYTGDTTPGQTGSATGTGSGSQAPVATATATPTQEIKPEAAISVPIGFAMPGGIVDQASAASSRGNAGTDKTSTNTPTTTITDIRQWGAAAQQMAQAWELLGRLFGIPVVAPRERAPDLPTSQPATPGGG